MLNAPERIYPLRKGEWIVEEDHVVLLKPKSRFKILRLLWGENFRIHLDEKGSFVWSLLDGTISVWEIAQRVGEKFSLENPLESTEKFLAALYRGGFLELLEKI